MYLKKKKNILNTTRNKSFPEYLYNKTNSFFFFLRKKNKQGFGRNNTGQTIIFSKKKNHVKTFYHNSYHSWSNQTALIINFKQIFFKNFFFLLKFANGSISLKKSIFGTFLGDFLNFFFFF